MKTARRVLEDKDSHTHADRVYLQMQWSTVSLAFMESASPVEMTHLAVLHAHPVRRTRLCSKTVYQHMMSYVTRSVTAMISKAQLKLLLSILLLQQSHFYYMEN